MRISLALVLYNILLFHLSNAQRVPVLNQIDLPHNYYFRELYLPQLTSGPSSVSWSADGKHLIYSMNGSLWIQEIGEQKAIQLTDDDGYDYQPDVSPDGKKVIFVRYNGASVELMLLDMVSGLTTPLTNNKAVNLEPRWSPDGSGIAFVSTSNGGHFVLHFARFSENAITDIQFLNPDQKSSVRRYYYSPFDHSINPTWSPDGKKLFFISNREIAHGTGDIVSLELATKELKIIHHEETSWRTNPDISPDGTRLVYSSYLGRNWNQLWMVPSSGGYPVPLTYGEYDNTVPRWSPDGKKIAFISNRTGNTSLWLIDVLDGKQERVLINDFQYQKPHTPLTFLVKDQEGKTLPCRVSITDSQGKFYGPPNAWIQADDSRYPKHYKFESHYFHSNGSDTVMVPRDRVLIDVSHGPEYEVVKKEIDIKGGLASPVIITIKKKSVPQGFENMWSGDLHVHMNYGGNYRSTPAKVIEQAEAENLNFVSNMIVNKEQRFPDISYFSPGPDKASTANTILLHAQEFHTSFWGHLGLLNLNDHLILPGYSGYPETAVESLFPHNGFIADRAHEQNGLVGYVHPFEQSEVIPDQSPTLYNELPVDIALEKVNYYELAGFSDHKASEKVWHQLLNCGFRIPAGAGTDAMTNYASLRGPVGLCRVYVKGEGNPDHSTFLKKVARGQSFVTNGPLIGFTIDEKNAGDTIPIATKGQTLSYSAFLRSNVQVDHFEVIYNGEVVAKHELTGEMMTADVKGTIKVNGSGWLLVRAWNNEGHPDLPDLYPFASTNPVYIQSRVKNPKQKEAASYFLKWVDRIEKKANELVYRNDEEKEVVMSDIRKAKSFYQKLLK